MKEPVAVKLYFDDWKKNGVSVYQTEEGIELSTGDFHSGTVFHGLLFLDRDNETDLLKAVADGFTPAFVVFEAGMPEEVL